MKPLCRRLLPAFAALGGLDLHMGFGHGWTDLADKRVLKPIASVPFQSAKFGR